VRERERERKGWCSDEYVYESDAKTGKVTKCHHTYAPVMDWLVVVPRTQGFSSTEIRRKVKHGEWNGCVLEQAIPSPLLFFFFSLFLSLSHTHAHTISLSPYTTHYLIADAD